MEVFSVDHGVIGAMLLTLWNIPKAIIDGVMYHHNPEEAEENQEHAMVINCGNKFAKKINLRDNFTSFDEFFNKHRDFVYIVQNLGVDLMPSEELKFFERAYVLLKNAKGFFEGVLEEKHD